MYISRARVWVGDGQPQAEFADADSSQSRDGFGRAWFDAMELLAGSRGHPGARRLLRDDFLFDFLFRFCPRLPGENEVFVHPIELGAIPAPVDGPLRIGSPMPGTVLLDLW